MVEDTKAPGSGARICHYKVCWYTNRPTGTERPPFGFSSIQVDGVFLEIEDIESGRATWMAEAVVAADGWAGAVQLVERYLPDARIMSLQDARLRDRLPAMPRSLWAMVAFFVVLGLVVLALEVFPPWLWGAKLLFGGGQ